MVRELVGSWPRASRAVERVCACCRNASFHRYPGSAPKERAGHHYIELSRAYLLQGSRLRALEALYEAKMIAPVQTRYNPMVHETVRALARAETRKVDTVHGFAVWCGITDRL